jgi:hypothetical protein
VSTAPAATVSAIGGRVLVLNASYEPINVCTVRRAAVLLLKRRAELLERSDDCLHSEHVDLERPPRSRGGLSVWDNIVAACAPCNRRKGNRLPAEIEMHPASAPKAPGPTVFIRIAAPRVPPSWEPYLSFATAAA